jgi:hypothetical protein
MIDKPHTRQCPICQKELAYKDLSERNRGIKNGTPCRSCANSLKRLIPYEGIPVSWYNSKVRRATQRGYEFTVTIEQVWDIYIAQNKVCALSGVPITFNDTASLDRIDNGAGYILGNIQIVHKDINYMKYIYGQDYFIKMCNLVARKHKVDSES